MSITTIIITTIITTIIVLEKEFGKKLNRKISFQRNRNPEEIWIENICDRKDVIAVWSNEAVAAFAGALTFGHSAAACKVQGGLYAIMLNRPDQTFDSKVGQFVLQHELGHINNGDLEDPNSSGILIDINKEIAADNYAASKLGLSNTQRRIYLITIFFSIASPVRATIGIIKNWRRFL